MAFRHLGGSPKKAAPGEMLLVVREYLPFFQLPHQKTYPHLPKTRNQSKGLRFYALLTSLNGRGGNLKHCY